MRAPRMSDINRPPSVNLVRAKECALRASARDTRARARVQSARRGGATRVRGACAQIKIVQRSACQR